MARSLGKRLTDLAATIAGREPTGPAAPPRTGTDPSSQRHLLALVVGTFAIMAVGLIVAFTDDGPSTATPTPTITSTPSPSGARLIDNPPFRLAA
jgi:hypothetical protein